MKEARAYHQNFNNRLALAESELGTAQSQVWKYFLKQSPTRGMKKWYESDASAPGIFFLILNLLRTCGAMHLELDQNNKFVDIFTTWNCLISLWMENTLLAGFIFNLWPFYYFIMIRFFTTNLFVYRCLNKMLRIYSTKCLKEIVYYCFSWYQKLIWKAGWLLNVLGFWSFAALSN